MGLITFKKKERNYLKKMEILVKEFNHLNVFKT